MARIIGAGMCIVSTSKKPIPYYIDSNRRNIDISFAYFIIYIQEEYISIPENNGDRTFFANNV